MSRARSPLNVRFTHIKRFAVLLVLCTACVAQTVIATVPAASPTQLDLNPFTRLVYVGNSGAGTVDIIDERTNTVVNAISLGGDVEGVAVNPFTSRLYVADGSQELLYVINTRNNQVIATIPLGIQGGFTAIDFLTNRVYVSDFETGVDVVDGTLNQVIAFVPIDAAHEIAINSLTNRIYVAQDGFPGMVTVLDAATNLPIATVSAGGFLTFGVAVNPVTNRIYAGNQFGTVGVIDGNTNTLLTSIPDAGQPAGLVTDPFANRAYVNNVGLNTVDVIDGSTNSVINTVPVGSGPTNSAIDPLHRLLYVGDSRGNAVSVISLP